MSGPIPKITQKWVRFKCKEISPLNISICIGFVCVPLYGHTQKFMLYFKWCVCLYRGRLKGLCRIFKLGKV